jgi:hypothetical protein
MKYVCWLSNIDETDSNEDNFEFNNVLSGTFSYYLKFIIINQTHRNQCF